MIAEVLHGKVIKYSNYLNCIPTRDSLAVGKCILDPVKGVLFLPSHASDSCRYVNGQREYTVMLYGVLVTGHKVGVVLTGIKPHFEVLVPDDITDIKSFENTIRKKLLAGKEKRVHRRREDPDLLEENIPKNKIEGVAPYEIKHIKAKTFKYFKRDSQNFLMLSFTSTKERENAILILEDEYTVTSNDKKDYFRVFCRNQMTTISGWVVLKNYEYKQTVKNYKCPIFTLDYKNYLKYDGEKTINMYKDRTLTVCWDIETWCNKAGMVPDADDQDSQGKIFCIGATFQWASDQESLFRVCFTQYPSAPNPYMLTVVCPSEIDLLEAFALTCESLKPELICGFNCSEYDWKWYITQANKYGRLINLVGRFGMLSRSNVDAATIKSFNWIKTKVKIDASKDALGQSLFTDGMMPIDVRTVFRQLYPTSEKSSLSYFLTETRLGTKADMEYLEMHLIIKESIEYYGPEYVKNYINNKYTRNKQLEEKMSLINYYCTVDARKCHELLLARNVILERRELSDLTCVSLSDSFYRANGLKVRNLTIAIGQQHPFNIRFAGDARYDDSKTKYPGAMVIPPDQGNKISKLSIPELIKKANFTRDKERPSYQEWCDVEDKDCEDYYRFIEYFGPYMTDKDFTLLKKLVTSGNNVRGFEDREQEIIAALEDVLKKDVLTKERIGSLLQDRRFTNFLREPMGRPITGLDFASLYPSIIRTYNLSPEYCVQYDPEMKLVNELRNEGHIFHKVSFPYEGSEITGHFLWHNNKTDPRDKDFKFGLFAYILDDLFVRRDVFKKAMAKKKIELEALKHENKFKPGTHSQEILDQLAFEIQIINSKQNAMKVFMNTFYGVAGSKHSPFYLLEVSGGVTQYGRKSLDTAYREVVKKNCRVYYGDTDSIYLSAPEHYFTTSDKLYYSNKMSKVDYWTDLIQQTRVQIDIVNKEVNQSFINMTNTTYLKMDYEEVLFPVVFASKKKYFGIEHKEKVVIQHDHLFIRGIETKKRGVNAFVKNVIDFIMKTSMNIENLYTLDELVLDTLDSVYVKKWNIEDFANSYEYRPHKQSCATEFVGRIHRETSHRITPGERFKSIIPRGCPFRYNERGCKIDLKISERMMLLEQAKEKNIEVDLDYYVNKKLLKQVAILISYRPEFHVERVSDTDAEIKKAEKKNRELAYEYLKQYCSKHCDRYNVLGAVYRDAFRKATKIMKNTLVESAGHDLFDITSANDIEKYYNEFDQEVIEEAMEQSKGYGSRFVRAQLDNCTESTREDTIVEMQQHYYGRKGKKKPYDEEVTAAYMRNRNIIMSEFQQAAADIKQFYHDYHAGIAEIKRRLNSNVDAELMGPTKEAKKFKVTDFNTVVAVEELEGVAKEHVSSASKIRETYKKLRMKAVANEITYRRIMDIIAYLKKLRDKKVKVEVRPRDMGDIISRSKTITIKNDNQKDSV